MAKKKDISEVKNEPEVLAETPVSKPKRRTKAKSTVSDERDEMLEREYVEPPKNRRKNRGEDMSALDDEIVVEREVIESPRRKRKPKPTYEPADEVWIPEPPKPKKRSQKTSAPYKPEQETVIHEHVESTKRSRRSAQSIDFSEHAEEALIADAPGIAVASLPDDEGMSAQASDVPMISSVTEPLTIPTSDEVEEMPKASLDFAGNLPISGVKLTRRKGRMVPGQQASASVSAIVSETRDMADIPNESTNEKESADDNGDAALASDEAESSPALPFASEIKLTRRKGKTVPAHALSHQRQPSTAESAQGFAYGRNNVAKSQSVEEGSQSAAHVAPVFEARILKSIEPMPESGMFDLRLLRHPMQRARGILYTREALQTLAKRHAGYVRAVSEDRAPTLNPPHSLAEHLDAKISSSECNALCQMLHDTYVMDIFDGVVHHLMRWYRVVHWYQHLTSFYQIAQLPLPGSSSAYKVNEPNGSPFVEPEVIEEENSAPDPAVAAIFDIFTLPMPAYTSDAGDLETIRRLHIAHHCDRITALFADWARSLGYIDKGVFGGPENKLLSQCFMERFQQILEIDRKASEHQGVVLPDIALKQRFYLDDVDMLLLWLLAGAEMDPNFKNALRETWEAMTVVYLSAGSLMRFFCTSALERSEVMDRLSPSSPMAMAGLFKIQISATPTQPLYFEIIISEQVTRQFAGISSLSLASTQYAELMFPHFAEDTYVADSHLKTFRIIKNYIDRPKLNRCRNLERENLDFVPSMAFLVEGLPGSGRTTLIKIMASRLNRPVIVVQTNPLASLHPTDAEEYLKTVFADAALMDAFVCLRDAGGLLTEEKLSSMLARQLAQRAVVCAMCVDLAVKTLPVIDPYITFKTKMDGNLKDNAVAYWTPHLNLPHLEQSQIDVLALSQRMALQPFQIQKATKLAYYSADFETDQSGSVSLNAQNLSESAQELLISNQELEKAAAVQVTKNIGNLAFVSDPEIDLSDVVVSDDIMEKIQQIIGSAINRRRVLYEWGLSRRIRRGTGVIALFDGEPGTGKTHSAEAIAHELGLSLMRVNIATMVDKYIGETEKNLTMIFEQARPDMQLLLFDEADSLFTKRTSNVSKSNDRYSNMSVNVLLQLVERYEGVSILTTNLKNAIDPAFERRITYKVYFPMPKKPERERLWKYMCPPDILTAEPIDYEWLSELEMSGGEIKNAVLTAAFTAATRGQLLDSAILYNAGVAEASAAGRVMRRYEEGEDFI